MPMLKVGKAPSTIAESIHEAEGVSAQVATPVAEPVKTLEYGAQKPGTEQHYTQQVNGQPHVPRPRYDPLVPTRSGYVTSIPLPFDIYGDGPIHILFLTGYGLSRHSWINQLEYFARKPEYSCLVIDNRGFEDMTAAIPLKVPGTKQFARDMKRALEDLGWNKPKSVHVLGFCLGGMVALQMGRVCPEYIASMHLVSTAAHFKAAPFDTANVVKTLQLIKNDPEANADKLVDLLFQPEYLYSHDPDYPEWKNNRERFLAKENVDTLIAKKQNGWNYYTQTLATVRHELDQAKMWEVAAKVRYLFVSSGDADALLHPDCAKALMVGLNCQGRIYQGGHMIPWQHKDALNLDQEAMMLRAQKEYEEYPPA